MIVFENPWGSSQPDRGSRDHLRIALINNMPDAAFRQTERQFGSLLAVSGVPIRLRRYVLPQISRSRRVMDLVERYYFPIDQLRVDPPDAVIVTGCEPLSAELSREPYWDELVGALNWAREHTVSTIASCLAAHATVLAFDGIRRQPLEVKRSGVFAQGVAPGHPLCHGLTGRVAMPHSRMNDVSTAALVACGYQALVASDDAGWTVATKDEQDHLGVLLQGHPEYDTDTLLLEYRRDVRRYLDGERSTYPSLPQGYVPDAVAALLHRFQDAATSGTPGQATMEWFPLEEARAMLSAPWRRPAETLISNWAAEVKRRALMREVAYG